MDEAYIRAWCPHCGNELEYRRALDVFKKRMYFAFCWWCENCGLVYEDEIEKFEEA